MDSLQASYLTEDTTNGYWTSPIFEYECFAPNVCNTIELTTSVYRCDSCEKKLLLFNNGSIIESSIFLVRDLRSNDYGGILCVDCIIEMEVGFDIIRENRKQQAIAYLLQFHPQIFTQKPFCNEMI